MRVETLVMTSYQANCHIVSTDQTLIVIDPGQADPRLSAAIAERTLDAVVCTHAHPDHVEGVPSMLAQYDAPFYLHPAGELLLKRFAPEVDEFTPLADEQTLTIGDLSLRVLHLPGHSPDGVALIVAAARAIFAGDLLFAGSVGRVDLPGSDPEAMQRSLKRLISLPGDYDLYSGHGPVTTLERERQSNPFLLQLNA